MFEAIEVGRKISKSAYQAQLPDLRVALVNAQYDLRQADFPVIIVLTGDDRIGCNALLHTLHEVMDARYMRTQALGRPTDEERERPRFWRYWSTLPRRGEMGVFLDGWPQRAVSDRVGKRIDDIGLERRIEHIRSFEQDLVADGALLIKFWLHLPKKILKKRLKAAKKNPDKAWQFSETDWKIYEHYDAAMQMAEQVVRETNTGEAPWHLIESTNAAYRALTVSKIILEALTGSLSAKRPAPKPTRQSKRKPEPLVTSEAQPTILSTVDLTQTLEYDSYRQKLDTYQARLYRLTSKARERGLSSVWVFEGWDAAGKGGVIRRLTAAMDPENYHLFPIAAPTEEEQAYPYLWRFWRRLPRAGKVAIFDRSWYGRVLVERVEGFARQSEWQRAYYEINDFEEQLYEHGIVLLKFWLHLDPDEQLRRFQARETTPYKKYKITEEDYRNRDQWLAYEHAVHDMVAQTSTACAPWHLVASQNKRWARVEVLKTICRSLKTALKG